MLIKIRNIIFLIFLGGLLSCEERFQPEIISTSQTLVVVDGMINNLPGPYTVKLSVSSKIEAPEYVPLSGFSVMISDDHGEEEWLQEINAGEYVTSPNGIQGMAGRKYQLTLISPDGKHYASKAEMLQEPTTIDSVDHKLEFQSYPDLIYDIAGYRFYLNTGMAPADTTFFLWQLVSTFKYKSDFKIYWIYDGTLRPVFDYDSLQVCYSTEIRPDIFLLSTASLAQPIVTNYPLHYVSTETRELSERYSLLVRQFSISEPAYKFWRIVKEQNTGLGNLYSKQPFQTEGNIENIENPDETVLGYFMVAGISEKRIFVDKPKPPVMMRYPQCEFNEDVYQNFGAIKEFPPSSWPMFATRGPKGNALPNQWCMDCRESGGVLQKPNFWID